MLEVCNFLLDFIGTQSYEFAFSLSGNFGFELFFALLGLELRAYSP
jgi:hypothetical protein